MWPIFQRELIRGSTAKPRMNPVFQREMRAQSRGPKPWRLRMFVAGAAILGLATLGLKAPAMFVGSGKDAFFVMNFGAMALLGIVSPMLTHDLLSRERREGTLGLLCSTPLTSREMVVGKVTAACTQALGAWLAMGPLLMLPMLQGGVTHAEIALMFVLQGGVTVSGLGAGLASSAWNRQAGWALFSAYALLAMVLATVIIPVGVVLAATSGLATVPSMYVLTGVVAFCTLIVALGFYYLAGQEAEHTWTRIQFLGEVGDESLVELGVATAPVAPAVAAPANPSRSEPGSLPDDGTPDRVTGSAPKESRPLDPMDPGLIYRWQAKRAAQSRERDPWLWLVSRRTDVGWQVAWFVLGAYLWWLGSAFGRQVPVWPVWVILGLLTFRVPSILREERRNGLLEVLATTPGLGQLPGAVCRRIWFDFGTFLGTHLLVTLAVRVYGGWEGSPLPVLAGMVSLWAAPWVGLWVVGQTQNYFLGGLLAGLGIQGIAWFSGLAASLCLNRWMHGNWYHRSDEGDITALVVQVLVQVGIGLSARGVVKARFAGGALLDDGRLK